MNILIPHQWLLEHLETSATPKDIQRLLSLSGPSVERIYDREGDSVYDIEVTTNRVDSMSVRGIAREAAVILNHAGVQATLKPFEVNTQQSTTSNQQFPLPQIVNNEKLCPRIMCVVLSDVKRHPTPTWMATHLLQTEMNIHDAVIDITNYITHELGHPCHAFDYDKVMALGGKIIVKEAEQGKKFVTLDGVEYTTVGGEVVFENEAGEIIDLPGIKGTANTAIDDNTQRVLFWLESIDSKKIRFTSMTHAIRTTAAQLNEKKVDPELMPLVLQRGIELYQQLTEAQIASEIVDMYPQPRHMQAVEVPTQRISDYLGIELELETIQHILEDLGCQVTLTNNQKLTALSVTPPSFRPDLTITADIIEEIARIYGYHNLPSKIMDTAIPLQRQEGVDFHLESNIKHFLANIGWQEVYTYSMISKELAEYSGAILDEHVTIQNPLTDDRVHLRTTLIPSLNEVVENNPTEKEVAVFEIANVYYKQPSSIPTERLMLGMVSNKPYREVKGDLEALLDQFHLTELSYRINSPELPYISQSMVFSVRDNGHQVELGTVVIMNNGRVAMQLGIANLIAVAKSHPTYIPEPKTALIVEDFTFTLPEKTLVGEVLTTMKTVSPLIYTVELSDIYKRNYTFTVKFLDPNKNLSKDEVEPVRVKLIQSLNDRYRATLIGEK